MQQTNHSLTSIMKHPALSSLLHSLYSIAFPRWHPAKHNPCSQHSGEQGLKVTWHHSSITLYYSTLYSNAGSELKRKMCLKTNTVASLSAEVKVNHRTTVSCRRRSYTDSARRSRFSNCTLISVALKHRGFQMPAAGFLSRHWHLHSDNLSLVYQVSLRESHAQMHPEQ